MTERNTHGPTYAGRPPVLAAILAVLAAASISLSHASQSLAAEPTESFPQVVHVEKTFNQSPFDYRIESRKARGRYSIYRLSYPSPVVTPLAQNNTVPAEYYVPNRMRPEDAKRPAVICMHILDGNFALVRMTCSKLASHGIPAMMFKLPYYGERGFADGPRALATDPKLFVDSLAQGLDDVRRTVDLLASRPEIDPDRIGITGISLGGIVAAAASGIEPRLGRAMLILAGGDLRQIIHHAEETEDLRRLMRRVPPERGAEIRQALDAIDPLRHAPGLRDRARQGKVLMINAAEDEVIAPPCTQKLAEALGIADQVVWLKGLGHYTAMAELPQILQMAVEFFGEDLPPGLAIEPPSRRPDTAEGSVVSLVQEAFAFLLAEPDEGQCHFVDFTVSATRGGTEKLEARMRFIHGANGRFKIETDLPMVGGASMGQQAFPWMVAGGKALFKGSAGPERDSTDPLEFADPEHLLKLRMVAGAAAGLAIAPHILNQWLTVTDDTAPGGPPTIQIVLREEDRGSLRLVLKDDATTPRQVTFDVAGVQGTVTFNGWQTHTVAHETMFDPPSGLPEKEVDRTDLYRVFSAMFDFAMESAQ